MAFNFEWNLKKAKENFRKHGVAFEEAATVFGDLLSITIPDPLHSYQENRFVIIGQSAKHVLLVVAHTDRKGTIRIINARRATAHERKQYEETN
jgi:uncharacterized DUF497 family protein